jgi:hypothetical protein
VWHWRRIRCGGLKCARAVFERDAAIPSSGASVRLDAVTVTELLRRARRPAAQQRHPKGQSRRVHRALSADERRAPRAERFSRCSRGVERRRVTTSRDDFALATEPLLPFQPTPASPHASPFAWIQSSRPTRWARSVRTTGERRVPRRRDAWISSRASVCSPVSRAAAAPGEADRRTRGRRLPRAYLY